MTLTATNTSDIGATIIAASLSVGAGGTTGAAAAIGAALAQNLIGWTADGDRAPAEVKAYLSDSLDDAGGNLSISDSDVATVDALVFAGSMAVGAAGTTGIGLAGSGVSAVNKIATEVWATIDGAAAISADAITLNAHDASVINANAGAASLAVGAAGTTGGALSIGVALAQNEIDNDVEASIASAASVESTFGAIALYASEAASIHALAGAAAIAAGFGGTTGVALSGAGADATNVILGKTNAFVRDSVLGATGDVTLDAHQSSTIEAKIIAASLAIGGGGTTGVGASIGAALAQNLIGWTGDGVRAPIEVKAYVENSSINPRGDLTATATADGHIDALVVAGSVPGAGGRTAGVAASGSGVDTENRIAAKVQAYIDGDGTLGVHADRITLTALDTSTISATAGAPSVAASFAGTAGVSVSIGVALAYNEISSEVAAFVAHADDLHSTLGDVALSATESASITGLTGAASLAAGIAGTAGIGVSGAGADATNVILNKANAYMLDSTIVSARDVLIGASDNSTISATVATASLAIGAGGAGGGGASIRASPAENLNCWVRDGTASPPQVHGDGRDSSNHAGPDLPLPATQHASIA